MQENIRNLGNYQFISKLMIFSRTKLNSGANLFRIKVLVDQKFNDVISILNNPSITFSKCGGIICKEQWTNLSLINKDFWPIVKVEKILKGSLDLIPSPSPSVKIQIMGGKVSLRCKGKTLLGIVNKLWKQKGLLTSPSNVLPYYLK